MAGFADVFDAEEDMEKKGQLYFEERAKRAELDADRYVALPIVTPVPRLPAKVAVVGAEPARMAVKISWMIGTPGIVQRDDKPDRAVISILFPDETSAMDMAYILNQGRKLRELTGKAVSVPL